MPSPGMLEKHYSPRATLTLYEGADAAVIPLLIDAARAALARGQSVGIIAAEEDRLRSRYWLRAISRVLLRTVGSQEAPELVASRSMRLCGSSMPPDQT